MSFIKRVTLHCDSCDNRITLNNDITTVAEARKAAKEFGWHNSGKYDMCPKCYDVETGNV